MLFSLNQARPTWTTAPATAALARASAAEGTARATQQQALCELDLKGLVALTALSEPELRRKLAQPWSEPLQVALAPVASVPADQVPLRVTEIGYWKRKHAGIEDKYWTAPRVGRRSNCKGCHLDADAGTFEDAGMRLPAPAAAGADHTTTTNP